MDLPAKAAIIEIESKCQLELLANAAHRAIVYFYKPWCKPCSRIFPALESIANANDITVLKVDMMAFPNEFLDVSVVPTFYFYYDGSRTGVLDGAQDSSSNNDILAARTQEFLAI